MSSANEHHLSGQPQISGSAQGHDVIATPKLINTLNEVKETMLPSEWEFMREVRRGIERGMFFGAVVGTGVSVGVSRAFLRRVHPIIRIPLGITSTFLFSIVGGMTVVPHFARLGLFTLPNDSQLRMAIMHVMQLNNPMLNPQQMWSLTRKQKSWPITNFILQDFPIVSNVYQVFRPMYDDPAYIKSLQLIERGQLRHAKRSPEEVEQEKIIIDELEKECSTEYEKFVFRNVLENIRKDDEFRRELLLQRMKSIRVELPIVDPIALLDN